VTQRGFIQLFLMGYAALAAGFVIILSVIAYRIYDAGGEHVELQWAEAKADQRKKDEAKIAKASDNLEKANAKARVITREIRVEVEKIIERPIYSNVCLDSDGLRLARCAIRGQSANSCEPDKPMRPVTVTDGWNGKIRLALDYGNLGAVSGVR